jgi:hypothetical protein
MARAVAAVGILAAAGPALAADAIGSTYQLSYCDSHQATALLSEANTAVLRQEVGRLMDEAVVVSNDHHWIYSGRPVFVWASEAKYACGKAYGYLKTSYRDEQNLNDCGCAYERMQHYMH